MDNSLKTLLADSGSIVILLPKDTTLDQVAAGLSLYLALEKEKDISIYCPDPMLVEFNRLIGINKVGTELGNKNLIIKFTNYQADGIERVSYDIEGSEFKLTIIPKPRVIAPTRDQIAISHSGISADTAILIGGQGSDHFPVLNSQDFMTTKLIHIGTASLNIGGKEVISLAEPSSSVSELMTRLIEESELELNQDLATNLLMGIYEGSANFSKGVTQETFGLAAKLMGLGGKYIPEDKIDRSQFPAGAIPRTLPPALQRLAPQIQQFQQMQQMEPQLQPEEVPQPQPEEEPNPLEAERKESPGEGAGTPPKSWLEPKIFKSTSNN